MVPIVPASKSGISTHMFNDSGVVKAAGLGRMGRSVFFSLQSEVLPAYSIEGFSAEQWYGVEFARLPAQQAYRYQMSHRWGAR